MNKANATLSLLEVPRAAGPGKPALFLVLESGRPRAGGLRIPLGPLDTLQAGRGEERAWSRDQEAGAERLLLRIPDPRLSSSHFLLARMGSMFLLEDAGSKNGTLLSGTRTAREPLKDGDVLQAGETFFLYRDSAVLPDDPTSPVELVGAPGSGALSTIVPAFARELSRIQAVARSPLAASVVLQGESGTGKELVARAVHALSERTGPFVPVNCGALPASLVESELFGFRKGAFSGATEDRPGLIRSANGGTLFLDEIGDLPLPAQAALLRVLQEREVRAVGGTQASPVDIRVVSATHRDLADMTRAGTFREDLLARLSGFTARLPPLRERLEDLGVILATLLARLAPGRTSLRLSAAAAQALLAHRWPGNVRELEQALSRSLALAPGDEIGIEHLDLTVTPPAAPRRPLTDEDQRLREELLRSLEAHQGNVSAVARAMGKDRKQIRRWIERFGLGRRK